MKKIFFEKKAFTLIELLIAIAILGILTASLLASYTTTQKRSRDTQRKHDLRQIQEALELYFQDNDAYPTPAPPNGLSFGTSFTSGEGVVYMQEIPSDSRSDRNYFYTQTNNQEYKIYACLENLNDEEIETYSDVDCGAGCSNNCNYGISSPNTLP